MQRADVEPFRCYKLTVELRVADYWEVARLFENILGNIQSSLPDLDWDEATQLILNSSASLQQKYAKTLAGFGVEVYFLLIINLTIRCGHGRLRIFVCRMLTEMNFETKHKFFSRMLNIRPKL